MPQPNEGTQAKEVLRMIEDFKADWDCFFSKGYLNSDGKKALIRLLRAGLQIAYDLKGSTMKKYRRGSETDVEEILSLLKGRLIV